MSPVVKGGRLSANFHVREFRSPDGVDMPPSGPRALGHLVDWFLQPLRDEFGACTVHSGHRSQEHNARVGGARRSVHLMRSRLPLASGLAAAADVSFERGTPRQWAAAARELRERSPHLAARQRGGIGLYPTFVHLDTWDHRDWTG